MTKNLLGHSLWNVKCKECFGSLSTGVNRDDDPRTSRVICHHFIFFSFLRKTVLIKVLDSDCLERKAITETLDENTEPKCFRACISVIVFYCDSTAAASSPQLVLNDAWPQQARIGDYGWTGRLAKIVSFSSSRACFHSLSSLWLSKAWAALQMCKLSLNISAYQWLKYREVPGT